LIRRVSDASSSGPPFTWVGFRDGAWLALAFGGSSLLYGIAFGALASEAGLSAVEAAVMSITVFSGTAQMAVLQMWQTTLALLPVFFTVLMMNTRYFLMGAALRPWFGTLPISKTVLSLFFLVDSAFVIAMREKAKGNDDAALMVGAGVVSFAGWVVATVIGCMIGRGMGDPRVYGLDTILVLFCASSVASMWQGGKQLAPAAGAAAVAIVVDRMGGGPWAIAVAGVVGALIGAVMHGGKR
jgi:predicted branched-subunit amino acid permease